MIKLKNILAENMRRFGTKNLSEEFSDIEKLAFGGPRDPKTGNLIAPDTDQNNNGYPDSTEGNLVRTNVNAYYTTAPIAKADLIAKLEPLKKLFPKITDRDLKALTFVGTKSDTTKIYKALGALRVQDYFDPPNDDSEFSGSGTWVIDTMSASDEGLIK